MLAPHTRFSATLLLSLLSSTLASGDIPAAGTEDHLGARALFDEPGPWHHASKRALGKAWTGTTVLSAAGNLGIGAMQLSVIDNDHFIAFDKSESNTLQVKGHSAWGAIYTISTQAVRPLDMTTNSFCAGGGWLSNGTLVSVGGNPNQGGTEPAAAGNGLQAVRLFTPCTDNKCDVYENAKRMHLTSSRWYPSTVRLTDGSILIMGGQVAGGFNNQASTDNPTMEFYPPKGNGLQFYSKFLHDALNTNLFPITFALPNGQIFVVANHLAMLYDWKNNVEYRIPGMPNGVRVNYPASAASVLLPLTIANKWTPEVLICGGTTANTDAAPWTLSSQTPASPQCVRMVLTTAGIAKGWSVEIMPEARLMGDGVLTPDGKVFLVNGAATGIAGYGNVMAEIGASNAANPVLRPTLYDPLAVAGSRFSMNFPRSNIERLYHSSATLVPDGRILIAGSNPNDDVTTRTYATRYEIEMFSPPYISQPRPTFSALPTHILYSKKFTLNVQIPAGAKNVTCVIMDLGYSTHGVHMDNRLVELLATRTHSTKLLVKGPATLGIYPPGPAWLYVLADGVPSAGQKVMIGDGTGPPVSASAIANLLKNTKPV